MAYACRIIADSEFEDRLLGDGGRLTTFAITLPRIVLAELNTHRALSRNAASSRAIPIGRMIEQVITDPFVPDRWFEGRPGMQPGEELDAERSASCRTEWLAARDNAVASARALRASGGAKEIANRLLEPWMWTTVIVSATNWENFFLQRTATEAQRQIQIIALMMRDALDASEPRALDVGHWHLPFVDPDEITGDGKPQLFRSAARCARVSYHRQDDPKTAEEDRKTFDGLIAKRHWSPLEHQARPIDPTTVTPGADVSGNFDRGWNQHRKMFQGENGRAGR